MTRATWGSRLGFIFAVAGSAIGLANIWRFPFVVGNYGGAAFIAVYILCLLLIGFPVFMSEVIIGRSTQKNPADAFRMLGGNQAWGVMGKMTIVTGFIVSAFYSAVAGWILGYLIEAFAGNLTNFTAAAQPIAHYESLMTHPLWGVGFHTVFMFFSVGVLFFGVRAGIEKFNKIFLPILFVILIGLVVKGLTMPNAWAGIKFLLQPDWSALTPTAILIALGQSFFTLSVGQGTLVTYGSYLDKKENLISSCLPVVLMDTFVSILAALAVFTIVFSVGLEPNSGPGLIFHTLPLVFSQIPGGYFVAIAFFFLVLIAALTSEISAMEPTIAYFIDRYKWSRSKAVLVCGLGVFLLGIPCALSTSVLKDYPFFGTSILDGIMFVASDVMIPLGGFAAVLLCAWVWGMPNTLDEIEQGSEGMFFKHRWLINYFRIGMKYTAPILIALVFLHAVGVFS